VNDDEFTEELIVAEAATTEPATFPADFSAVFTTSVLASGELEHDFMGFSDTE
jgi:hypothetical protein